LDRNANNLSDSDKIAKPELKFAIKYPKIHFVRSNNERVRKVAMVQNSSGLAGKIKKFASWAKICSIFAR
jgi:hypothetical protein